MSPQAQAVLAVLEAEHAPVRSKAIASVTGIPWRQVIDAVRELRRAGHLIGAAPAGGYYLIRTEAEARQTRAQLVARLRGIRETIDALDAAHPQLAQPRLIEEAVEQC